MTLLTEYPYLFRLDTGNTVKPQEFLSEYQLPTIAQFEELLERCSWTSYSEDGLNGYKITGPNGNVIIMPRGILNQYLTAECLIPNKEYYYFLYLGHYTHSLAKGVPNESNIWTIKK